MRVDLSRATFTDHLFKTDSDFEFGGLQSPIYADYGVP